MSLDTVRCIVTGHDAQGRAIVTDDTRLETRMNPSRASAATVVWTTSGSPMHRTSSLDYGIVLSGQVELILDDGAITVVEAGEVVIQRGTIHAWRNSTDKVARIAFVLLDASPATVKGESLPDVHITAGVKPDVR
jgi:quercetin dioxygenase-like cupin family protein